MNQMIKDILTGIDGQSYALVKVIGFAVVLLFMSLEILAFITGKPFDGQAYGIGAGAAIAAMGAAIKLSEKSEPPP
jgi:uncharacterized membrane protein